MAELLRRSSPESDRLYQLCDLSRMNFVKFMVQFIDFGFRALESFLSGSRHLVYTTFVPIGDLQAGS